MQRQHAVLQADDEHAGEFQSLGGVQGQQRHALGALVPEISIARERDDVKKTRLIAVAALRQGQ